MDDWTKEETNKTTRPGSKAKVISRNIAGLRSASKFDRYRSIPRKAVLETQLLAKLVPPAGTFHSFLLLSVRCYCFQLLTNYPLGRFDPPVFGSAGSSESHQSRGFLWSSLVLWSAARPRGFFYILFLLPVGIHTGAAEELPRVGASWSLPQQSAA